MNGEYTPTEQKIMDLLSDGQAHSRREIHACLPDDLGLLSNIKPHIGNLRKKLPKDQAILCEIGRNRKIFYRLVSLLSNNSDD